MKFLIRASYPNFYMKSLFAKEGREPFDFDNESPDNPLAGNKPGTVIYYDERGERREYPPRWYDMYLLLRLSGEEQERYLKMMNAARHSVASVSIMWPQTLCMRANT